MLRGLLLILFLLSAIPGVTGQSISSHTRKELELLFKEKNPDSVQVKLLWDLGMLYMHDVFSTKESPDSAVPVFQQAIKLSKTIPGNSFLLNESLCLLGEAYFRLDSLQKGRDLFLQVIKFYQANGDKDKEALTWCRFGRRIKLCDETLSEIVFYFNQAAAVYRSENNIEKENEINLRLADFHYKTGQLSTAVNELQHVLQVYQSIGYRDLASTYYMMSVVNRYAGDLNKALSYSLNCIKSLPDTRDTTNIHNYYGELALVYQELGMTDKSIEWYRKTLAIREINSPVWLIYRTAGLLAHELAAAKREQEALTFMLGIAEKYPPPAPLEKAFRDETLAFCYNALKQYKLAESYYQSMIKIYEDYKGYDEENSIAHQEIGTFYLNQSQFAKAGLHLRKALDLVPGNMPLVRIKEIEGLLVKVDSANGDYLSALKHFRLYQQINDSIFNETKSKQIEELQVQYETVKKDQDIQLLTKQGVFQQTQLRQAALLRNVTFGSIGLLLIIVVLLYNRYRLKQRANKKLELQHNGMVQLVKEKEWLLKEIHHRVKNNLHIVTGLLDNQSAYLKTDEAVDAIRESQHRVNAMSMIHQKLYQSENLSATLMSPYIHELTEYLKDSFGIGQRINFNLQIEPVELDISHAIPVGLILNEAITNAIKYAFPPDGEGIITIQLRRIAGSFFLLSIADNGAGLPSGFNTEKTHSMGMSLMRGLSEDIDGRFTVISNHGTEIKIEFEYNPMPGQRLVMTSSEIHTEISPL